MVILQRLTLGLLAGLIGLPTFGSVLRAADAGADAAQAAATVAAPVTTPSGPESAPPGGALSPAAWAKNWLATPPTLSTAHAYLGRVVFTGALQGEHGAQFLSIPAPALAGASCLEAAPPAAVAWAYKINGLDQRRDLSDAAVVDALMQLGEADAVVRTTHDGGRTTLELLRAQGPETLQKLGSATVSGKDTKATLAALHALLGYDAFVLAQDQDYLLVRAPAFAGDRELHAVALGDSATSFTIPPTNQNAIALLKLIASDGRYAVFRILSTKASGPLPVGTKIVIDQPAQPDAAGAGANAPGPTSPNPAAQPSR